MPSYGFFIRHVKNLKMHDVQISYMKDEPRPPFILDDVKDAIFYDIQAEKSDGAPVFMMKNVQDISIEKVKGTNDTKIKKVDNKKI